MTRINYLVLFLLMSIFVVKANNNTRYKYNFNSDWYLHVGDIKERKNINTDKWKKVVLPCAFNEDEAFRLPIDQLTDTVMWYRKTFRLPMSVKNKKVFIEFEGIRQSGDFYINGHYIGLHENGTMAFGFDLTPYIKKGDNLIEVRIDNDWNYTERLSGAKFLWNNLNFNASYGGIPKNVWLHVTDKLYQTLPLYSNLKTAGVYVYAEDIKIKSRKAIINAVSEIKNEYNKDKDVTLKVELIDRDEKLKKTFQSKPITIKAGETVLLSAASEVDSLHFWSWGYGYLYTVKTSLVVDGKVIDEVKTKTGFRKTRFADGKFWLNDRVIQLKGFAQRTSNEWPAVGMSVPAWLSDFSNGLMVECNANLVRWMHTTPWKQDVESCDRVGLMQSMPAGDAETDCSGRQWEMRKELMRDAIIYNRNNPSIIFYESGNESISREHILEMKEIRDKYDKYGGRAIGSREMLDIRESEYGGEMLSINKSSNKPMWAHEYCRDEALRKYWDDYSYPYHKNGQGNNFFRSPTRNKILYNVDASMYNRNQDSFTIENIIRWYEYWLERPGTGKRVNSGGVKIVFSDTNTHYRGVENYRRSGDTDAIRIPKDPFFAHRVMWNGWVDTEEPDIHIVGHWNYNDTVVKPVYVVSNSDKVQLFLNGKSLGYGEQKYRFLYTFDNVSFVPGKLEAVGYDSDNNEICRTNLTTVGKPERIKLSVMSNPLGWKADGADMILLQVEVVDKQGLRCPLANNMIQFKLEGPAEWRGGIAQGENNCILSTKLPVECGINRALVRSLTTAGKVRISASSDGLESYSIEVESNPIEVVHGLSTYIPGDELKRKLDRGETPLTPSYRDTKIDVNILSATAGSNSDSAHTSFDDNELSEWKSDSMLESSWVTYKLERTAFVNEVCVKMTNFEKVSYPIDVYAGEELIWTGDTECNHGYFHINMKPTLTDEISIRLRDKKNNSQLGIVEIEFKENILE